MLFPTVSCPSSLVASISLLPNRALPELFPVSLPCRRFRLAPSQRALPMLFARFPFPSTLLPSRSFPRSSPQAVFHSFLSVHPISTLPYRSFPTELSPSYFPCFPLRPHIWSLPYRFFPMELSPSISHGFLPFTLSSLPYRSFPTELSPCYFPGFRSRPFTLSSPYRSFPTELSPSYFPRFPFRPPCRRFHLQLLPHGALPSLFPTASPSATLSSLPSRCFPTELSPCYFPRFLCVHLVVASVSLLPNRALPKLFPTVSPPSTYMVASVSLLPNGTLPMLFPLPSHPAVASVGKERCGSDDKVDGRETVGNSMGREGAIRKRRQGGRKGNLVGNSFGRAPLGRGDMEATTEWMEGKRWEITWGELRWEGAKWNRGK